MKAPREHKKARPRPTAPSLDTKVLTGAKDFIALQGEWNELYQSCPSVTPFQSWEWLYSWWEVYGEGYKLRLITLRDEGGLLVGLLPLMVRRGRLLLLGGTAGVSVMTSYKDFLVREGWQEQVARAGARALKALGGWWVADLQELRPEAAAWEVIRNWDGPQTTQTIDNYVLIRNRPWEELLASLNANARKNARKTLRRLQEDGVQYEPVDLGDAERAAGRLITLHRELWYGRRIVPEHLTQRYQAFAAVAARRMIARGIGRISEFRDDDGVFVSQFLLFDKDFVVAWVIGARQDASRRYQFNTLSIWDAMNVARGRAAAYVSLLSYAIQEKLRWADEVVPSHRAILFRSSAFWIPYAAYPAVRDGYYSLHAKAQLYLHSESAPRWAKKVTDGYYTLQRHVHSENAPQWVKKASDGYYTLRHEYGYYALRYKYELARVHREMRRSSDASRLDCEIGRPPPRAR